MADYVNHQCEWYIPEKRCGREPCHTAARPSEHEGAKKWTT